MDLERKIRSKFADLRSCVNRVVEAVKDSKAKLMIENLSKEMALCLYQLKLLLNEIEDLKPPAVQKRENIEKLTAEIEAQNHLFALFQEYEY
jgi:methylphosphotriester-DNA--protein-cysteine methyltransferase